jgi:hypothetical protein
MENEQLIQNFSDAVNLDPPILVRKDVKLKGGKRRYV